MCFLLSNDPQDLSEDEAKGLSPGLCYLEYVCQILEEFAEQQRHNQAVQRQKNSLQTHLKVEACPAEPVVEVSHQVGFINPAQVGVLKWCCGAFESNEDSCLTAFQAFDSCQTDSGAASKREERSPSERRHPRPLHRHFRQRSASDANVATLHLSESQPTCLLHLHI